MTNLEKYDRLFLTAFRVKPEELPGLKYRGIPLWAIEERSFLGASD